MFVILFLNLIIAAAGFYLTKNRIKNILARLIFWLIVFIILGIIEYAVLSKLIIDSYSNVNYIQ